MDYTIFFISTCLIVTCIHLLLNLSGRRQSSKTARLPPGPHPLPIIGSLLKLGDKPHLSLTALAKTYGPMMYLKLGSKKAIVISSPQMAKEFFHVHDLVFAGRSAPDSSRMLDHHKYGMAWLPVGDQWGRLRRVAKENLFSTQQLDISQRLRQEKVQELLSHVNQCCVNHKSVVIVTAAFTTSLNVLSNFIFSTDLANYDYRSSQEFKTAVWGLMEGAAKPNLADFFPVLKPFDPQGVLRKANAHGNTLKAIFDRLIDQRLQARASGAKDLTKNDALDVLLDLVQNNGSTFNRNDLIHLFLDIFVAGTDTTASTMEWTMTELLRKPKIMAKAQSEVKGLINEKDNGLLEEADISRLPYLQAVVKESFRMHPAAPLLVPHKALSDVEVQGFLVPKDAQILCNVWAMGRDPNIWSNPLDFVPERFLDNEMDFRGRNFELIPFGAGRRMCPGLPLANRMVHLMLGSLISKYDWKLEGDMKAEDLDMSVKFGLTLQRNVPLRAIPIKI